MVVLVVVRSGCLWVRGQEIETARLYHVAIGITSVTFPGDGVPTLKLVLEVLLYWIFKIRGHTMSE